MYLDFMYFPGLVPELDRDEDPQEVEAAATEEDTDHHLSCSQDRLPHRQR